VHALDAASGKVIWTYTRQLPTRLLLCCAAANRGVALLGDRLFVGTLDAHLVALDASSGKVVWDVNVAGQANGLSISGAPLVVDDMVVTGVAGGEFGVRGFIDAYDAASGKRRWRFYTVPAPGESGSGSWAGDSWRTGGAPTWLTGSFDPQLRTLYWGVGNPSPNFYGEDRKGDNLYSDSVIALDADTGKLRWHFQFTPHDVHDWDAVQIPMLVDTTIANTPRKLLVAANRNGFYYVLDRINGQFLRAVPFVRQSWADGLDVNGRPIVRPDSAPSREGSLVYPGVSGATNWESPSYDPTLGLVYVPSIDRGSIFYSSPNQRWDNGAQHLGGGFSSIPDEEASVAVKALDVATGEVRWQYVRPMKETHTIVAGVLSTAGHIVFGGDLETFFALDSETGGELWRFDTGGRIVAAPISYRVGGRQYIAIAAGRSLFAFAVDTGKAPTKEAKATH
jgi:alcohol dehydrogenase (cytochrome c)